jgi:hypothetical protein
MIEPANEPGGHSQALTSRVVAEAVLTMRRERSENGTDASAAEDNVGVLQTCRVD